MYKKGINLILIMMFLFILPFASANSAILGDSANLEDVRISEAQPNNNFGGNAEFRVESGGGSGQISMLTWNISEANIPPTATNIRASLLLTSRNSNPITAKLYDATNTTWDENVITWNSFFCSVNATGQVVENINCTLIGEDYSLSGSDGFLNTLNITGWLSVNDSLRTIVIDAGTESELEWKGRTEDDGTPSNRPMLIVTWDVPPFNITIEVITGDTGALVITNTTQQTNSSILYGLSFESLINVNNDFGFKFNRAQIITDLTPGTAYFANQTNCNINGSCSVDQYAFSTNEASVVEVTLEDTLDLGTCLERTQDLVVYPELERAYVWGSDANSPFTTEKVAVVDISNPSSMSMVQCFSTGSNVGTPTNLGFMKDNNLGNSWLFGGGTTGTKIIRIDSTTGVLTNNGSLGVIMGDGAPRSPTNDFAFWTCDRGGDDISESLVYDGTDTQEFTTGFTTNCEGFMFPIGGFKGAYYLNEGIAFFDSSGMIAKLSGPPNNLGTGSGRDVFTVNENNIIANNGNANYYIFNPSTNNATLSATTNPNVNCFLKASSFIATNQVMYMEVCNSGNVNLRVNFLGETDSESVFNFTQTSTTFGTLEYNFPFMFAVINNAGNKDIISLEVVSSESQPGINKKPVIENVRPTANPVKTNTTINTFYDVNNPETSSLNEQILTANSCSYLETENFLQDFTDFNFSTCGQAIIGTRKGVEFGNALDLTQCSNDVISAGSTYTSNMIVSFDIFSTVNSTAEIELLQSDGTVITTLTFANINNKLGMLAGTQLIFNNLSTVFAGQDVPTRIFIQMSPGTGNANLVNKVAYSTNYFALNDNVDNTFCDTTEFCYVGNFITTSGTTLNDFTAIAINLATGDMALDNLRVVTTDPYPIYNSGTVLNNLNAVCNYPTTATNTNRIYASDALYGHNYLANTDVTYTVNQQGVITVPAVLNSSIGGIITGIVAIGGFNDDGSLLLLSLIFLVSASIGMYMGGMESVGIIFIDALLSTLFFFLGWMPLSVYVIVVLLASSLVALAGRNLFIGGGD